MIAKCCGWGRSVEPGIESFATRAAYPSMLRSPVASMRSPQTASSLGTRRTLQINSKGEVQAVPTSRAREYARVVADAERCELREHAIVDRISGRAKAARRDAGHGLDRARSARDLQHLFAGVS